MFCCCSFFTLKGIDPPSSHILSLLFWQIFRKKSAFVYIFHIFISSSEQIKIKHPVSSSPPAPRLIFNSPLSWFLLLFFKIHNGPPEFPVIIESNQVPVWSAQRPLYRPDQNPSVWSEALFTPGHSVWIKTKSLNVRTKQCRKSWNVKIPLIHRNKGWEWMLQPPLLVFKRHFHHDCGVQWCFHRALLSLC